MHNEFGKIFKNRAVLITGHTGFKGSWLAFWLHEIGADVTGYSLKPPTVPSHAELLDLDIQSVTGDIRDENKLRETFRKYRPEIVFHLAAQPLVKYSYENPVETYETNVIGTLKLFEACRKQGVRVIINITSDKCYKNKEWIWGYREDDPMGGYDPYSSSKGCAELLTSSYRDSYFNHRDYKRGHNTLIASCRAGNVIGGGDWAPDRLIPDIVNSSLHGEKTRIRNPHSVRPWQHVLEPLSGYLQTGQKLLEEKIEYAGPWNFGPGGEEPVTVKGVADVIKKYWEAVDYEICQDPGQLHEANLLTLDSTKACTLLNWRSVWNSKEAIRRTVVWYRDFYENNQINTGEDLASYIRDARRKKIEWTR